MGFFQAHIPTAPSGTVLTGQTIAVTGANTGLGYETCLQHLRLGVSHLIMGVRSRARGEQARNKLLSDPEVGARSEKAQITVLELDLAEYRSVMAFAEKVKETTTRLDVLYLNAGLNTADWKTTPAGHEELIQVHYLSNALLTFLLFPLAASTPASDIHTPHITWTGSMGQHFNSVGSLAPSPPSILAHLADRSKYAALSRYADSKFLVSVFVRQFGREFPLGGTKGGSGPVIVNNVCPGTVDTDIDLKHLPWYIKWVMALHRMLRGRPIDQGARTLLWAGELMDAQTHGQYISNNEISPLASYADTAAGENFSRQLWSETLTECRRVTAGRYQGALSNLT